MPVISPFSSKPSVPSTVSNCPLRKVGMTVSGSVVPDAVWDGCLIQQDLEGDARSIARDLLHEVTDKDRAGWLSSTPIGWASESFLIAISPEVGYCIRTETGCWYSEDSERLDDGVPRRTVQVDHLYVETHSPIVREQLVKAGVRLAGLLNQALGQ